MVNRVDKWPWPAATGGVHGIHAEELKALQRLEKNPSASPMPELAPTELITPSRNSDTLRFGDAPGVDPEDAPTGIGALSHVVLRRLRLKRERPGWTSFSRAVETERLDDLPENRRDQMRGMRRREDAMLDLVDRYNRLAEGVYGQLLSEAKG